MGYGLGFLNGAAAGSGSGVVLPLGPQTVVGRDPSVEIHLLPEDVSSRHAHLFREAEAYRIQDLHSTSGTFLDGHRIPPGEPVPLLPGQLVRFGEGGPLAIFDLLESLQDASADLTLLREDRAGGPWRLTAGASVGRGADCQVQLDPEHDLVASSNHLHLLPAFGRLVLTDLGSANGTFQADGRRVVQSALAPGDSFRLGDACGPTFRIVGRALLPPSEITTPLPARPPVQPAAIPQTFRLGIAAGQEQAVVQVSSRLEVPFGSFAGLNDFEVTCFPRELESESDAMERAEAIGPQHGSFVLTPEGVDLCDGGYAETKLNGAAISPQARLSLEERFELFLGDDTVGLRGRLLRHPRLDPTAPRTGMEHRHPVECLVIERMGDGPDSRLFLFLVRQASVGSSDSDAIRLVGVPGVAPQHALLYLERDGLWITQLGENPVAVNGAPLQPGMTAPIGIGSEFFVGAARFRVEE